MRDVEKFTPPAMWKRVVAAPMSFLFMVICRLTPFHWYVHYQPETIHSRLWIWAHQRWYFWFERKKGRV